MTVCSYCKKSYKDPRGLTVFTFDGRAVHYCSAKCRRNEVLKRDARKLNWVRKDKERMAAFEGRSVSEKLENNSEKSSEKEAKK
jgi:ribosomal protein L24E